jgi:hypothetical protein
MEGPGKQYPYENTSGLEPGRFKPIAEPGAEEKRTCSVHLSRKSMGNCRQGRYPFAYWPQPVPFNQDTVRTPVTCSQSNSSSVSQNSELVSSFKEVLSDFKKVDEPKSEQEVWKDPVNSIHMKTRVV